MQGLILEILNAQPSLRDSKTYLNSFGPRQRGDQAQQLLKKQTTGSKLNRHELFALKSQATQMSQYGPPPPLPPQSQSPPIGAKTTKQKAELAAIRKEIDDILSTSKEGITQEQNEVGAEAPSIHSDSHHFAQPDVAVRTLPDSVISNNASQSQIAVTPETQAALAESLSSPIVQQHTALVKVQGPFTARQMESIAEGLVYLKRLGLMSVVVLDSEDVTWRSSVSDFSPKDGKLLETEDLDGDLRPWSTSGGSTRSSSVGKLQEALRKQMLSFATRLSELLTEKGAAARPFTHAMMRIDANAVIESDIINPPHLTDCPSSSAKGMNFKRFNQKFDVTKIENRSPLVTDDSLASVRRSLANDMIPVIAPLALYNDPDALGAPRTVCVRSDDVIVGLTREMATEGKAVEAMVQEANEKGEELPGDIVDMMPLRLMVINREGGIPSHARGGNPHLSINLASEYSHISNSFIWDESHPTAVNNLSMVRDCLAFMPHTSSGVVVSYRSPKSLIANLITNKAAHSPSLPHRLLAGRKDVRHTPTIIRPGLSVRVLSSFDQVDWTKMTQLLQQSFRRDLDADAYYARLKTCLDFVIVMGDYQGAAIVTHEYAPGEDRTKIQSIAYLDKFAVLPSLQGSGAVDFLWGALRDEVHGLGLLDALNDNGGLGGFGTGRDLVWKSRSANPVNKWYFERSNGFVRIGDEGSWTLFWADAEQRLAVMSGERRLGAEASAQDIMDTAKEHNKYSWSARNEEEDAHEVSRQKAQSLMFTGDIDQLHPQSEHQRMLPVIAPNEQGRLARWAKCMASIPSAWL